MCVRWQCAGGGRQRSASVSGDHRFVSSDFQSNRASVSRPSNVGTCEGIQKLQSYTVNDRQQHRRWESETEVSGDGYVLMRAVFENLNSKKKALSNFVEFNNTKVLQQYRISCQMLNG